MQKLFHCKQFVCKMLRNPATRVAMIAFLAVIPVLAAADPFTAPITAVATLMTNVVRLIAGIAIAFGGISMLTGNHGASKIMEIIFGVVVMVYATNIAAWITP